MSAEPLTREEREAWEARWIARSAFLSDLALGPTVGDARRLLATVQAIEAERDAIAELAAQGNEREKALEARVEALRAVIQDALDDEETGEGWGPDVTVAAHLRAAIAADDEAAK